MSENNTDERNVRKYTLPGVLGRAVTALDWLDFRRAEVRRMFELEMFGAIPPRPEQITFKVCSEKTVFRGAAVRREVEIVLRNAGRSHRATALVFLPAGRTGCPGIVAMNFCGNPSCVPDGRDLRPASKARGAKDWSFGKKQLERWPFEQIVKSGYAIATCYRGDFFPDRANGRKTSVYRLFGTESVTSEEQTEGAISAWAFGYSRLYELLTTCPEIDPHHIYAHGHSRLGKTALWVAACDTRFAGAVSNCSGCCGASLSRRNFGETIESITHAFPWWFTHRLASCCGKVAKMPFDQHMLLALVAPRPLFVASAEEDAWADPKGEFLAAAAAGEVYRLFGAEKLPEGTEPPQLEELGGGDNLAYRIRPGAHNILPSDWACQLAFFDRRRRENTR